MLLSPQNVESEKSFVKTHKRDANRGRAVLRENTCIVTSSKADELCSATL
jgi:hypothetical protein